MKTKNWTGRFPAFVFAYGGPLKLAADLGVVHSSVYHWMSGSWPPKYKTAQRIVEIRDGAEFDHYRAEPLCARRSLPEKVS